jgi:hypothetical protein
MAMTEGDEMGEKREDGKRLIYGKHTITVEVELWAKFDKICKEIGINKSGYFAAAIKSLVAMQETRFGEVYENLIGELVDKDKDIQELKRLAEIGRKAEKEKHKPEKMSKSG